MSATANSLRDPRVLRGVSAFTWIRISLIASIAGMVIWSPIFLFQASQGFPRSSAGWIAVILPLIVFPTVAGVIGRVRQSTEKAAGYATILSPGSQLDLLDPHDGAVVWRVGDPPLRAVGLSGTLRGEQASPAVDSPPGGPAFPRKKVSNWVVQIVSFVFAFGVVIVVLSTTHSKPSVWGIVPIYLAFAAFGGLVLLLVFVQTRLTIGRRIRALSALRPDAMIFTSRPTGSLSQTLATLGVARAGSARFPVVVTDSAMEFWGSTGDAPWASIPWTGVTRVDPDSAPIGNNLFPAISLTLDHSGTPVTATLPIYSRQGIFSASPNWANQVFGEIRFHLVKP